jgi:DNA-3-methyladenine glycosylase I
VATTTGDVLVGEDGKARCFWGGSDADYARYHDEEWGRPVGDDRRLFEKLCLEGFQSGLSWLTILRKRENFRKAFAGFDPAKIARFGEKDVQRLLGDAGIIRHRGKIEATIKNAKAMVELAEREGSLAAFVWRHEPPKAGRPERMTREALVAMTTCPESVALSKALKKRGWGFVGPTTVYAFMQAMGLVNDHLEACAWRKAVEKERRGFSRPVSAGA